MIKLEQDGQIEITKPVPLYVDILLWSVPTEGSRFLPEGRYIVDAVKEDLVMLASADWDESGHVTYHSGKHGYRIMGEKNVNELRDALSMMGPKEWRPRKKKS